MVNVGFGQSPGTSWIGTFESVTGRTANARADSSSDEKELQFGLELELEMFGSRGVKFRNSFECGRKTGLPATIRGGVLSSNNGLEMPKKHNPKKKIPNPVR